MRPLELEHGYREEDAWLEGGGSEDMAWEKEGAKRIRSLKKDIVEEDLWNIKDEHFDAGLVENLPSSGISNKDDYDNGLKDADVTMTMTPEEGVVMSRHYDVVTSRDDDGETSSGSDPLNIVGLAGSVIVVVIIVAGVIGNLLVLLVIVRCRRLRRSYNAFIASLSVTDLIFNVLIMPFYVDSYAHRAWRFSIPLCRFHTYFGTMVVMTSALHVGLIAFNRYLLIVKPRWYPRLASSLAITLQVLFVWTTSFLTILPSSLGWHAKVGYSDQISRCNYVRHPSHVTLDLIFGIGCVFPCLVMIFCYVTIWLKTQRSHLRLRAHKIREELSPGRGRVPSLLPFPSAALLPSSTVLPTEKETNNYLVPPSAEVFNNNRFVAGNYCGWNSKKAERDSLRPNTIGAGGQTCARIKSRVEICCKKGVYDHSPVGITADDTKDGLKFSPAEIIAENARDILIHPGVGTVAVPCPQRTDLLPITAGAVADIRRPVTDGVALSVASYNTDHGCHECRGCEGCHWSDGCDECHERHGCHGRHGCRVIRNEEHQDGRDTIVEEDDKNWGKGVASRAQNICHSRRQSVELDNTVLCGLGEYPSDLRSFHNDVTLVNRDGTPMCHNDVTPVSHNDVTPAPHGNVTPVHHGDVAPLSCNRDTTGGDTYCAPVSPKFMCHVADVCHYSVDRCDPVNTDILHDVSHTYHDVSNVTWKSVSTGHDVIYQCNDVSDACHGVIDTTLYEVNNKLNYDAFENCPTDSCHDVIDTCHDVGTKLDHDAFETCHDSSHDVIDSTCHDLNNTTETNHSSSCIAHMTSQSAPTTIIVNDDVIPPCRVTRAKSEGSVGGERSVLLAQANELMTSRRSFVSRAAARQEKNRLNSMRMMLAIFLAFILTYMPFALTNLLDEYSTLNRNWYIITSLAFWAGSCVNPIIYGILNKQFRSAYVSLLCRCRLS